jgi:hypothetical protein
MGRSLRVAGLLVALSGAALGAPQADALAVDSLTLRYAGAKTPDGDGEHRYPEPDKVTMPWVHGGRAGVAARINELVFLHLLQMPAPRQPSASFTPPDIEPLDGFSQIGFTVTRNDARVLTLAMDMEQCGAHCTPVGETLSFDVQSGRRLLLPDLVTPHGRDVLLQRRNQAALDAYDQALDALPPEPGTEADADPPAPTAPHDPEAPDDAEQRDYLASCRSVWESRGATLALTFDLPAPSGLTLDISDCGGSPRQRSMDVGASAVSMPAAELAPLLTDYGRRIVLGEGRGAPDVAPFGQVLHGHVGTAAVTMYLDVPTVDWITGTYSYDRIGHAIALTGSPDHATWRLHEDGGKDFVLHRVGPALEGTWQGNGKTLPVRLD